MKKYLICVRNEGRKLLCRKKYLVFLLLGVALILLNGTSRLLVGKVSHGNLSLLGSSIAMSMLTLFADFLIPLVGMMAVCDLFSTEFRDQTIKASLLRPVSRWKLYAAKITAVWMLALVYYLVFLASALLTEQIFFGHVKNPMDAVAAYLLDWIPAFTVIVMATFLNQFGKSSTMAMFLCIMVYILLYLCGILFPNLSGLLFIGYTKWHTLWLGHSLPMHALLSKVALQVGYGLVFSAAGYTLFLKREV